MKLRPLGFQQKIFAAPLIAALGFGILFVLGLWLGARGVQALSEIETRRYPMVELHRDLESLLGQLQRELRDSVAAEDVIGLARADEVRDMFLQRLDQARAGNLIDDEKSSSIRQQFSGYYDLARGTSSRLIEVGFDNALADQLGQMGAQYKQLHGDLESRTRAANREIEERFADARRTQDLFLQLLAAIPFACIVILVLLSRTTATSVSRPLSQLLETVDRARAGDLTGHGLPASDSRGDEIAQLQFGFATMIESLRTMVSDTSASGEGLTETAGRLLKSGVAQTEDIAAQEVALEETSEFMDLVREGSAESLGNARSLAALAKSCARSVSGLNRSIAQTAGSIDARLRDVARAAEAVVEFTSSVPAAAKEVHLLREKTTSATGALSSVESGLAEASRAASLTQDMSVVVRERAAAGVERVDEMGTSMREIERGLRQLGGTIGELSARSRAIGEITEVIDNVADETSLLALNASIIAAQSGENGKSFGVVANQMRNLARRTAESTGEIRHLISEVQAAISEASGAAEEGEEQVRIGVTRTSAARELLQGIRESSDAFTEQVDSVVEQSGDHHLNVARVAEVVRGVEQMTGQFEQLMEEQSRTALEVQRSIDIMHEFAGLVQSASGEQRSESENLSRVADEVAASSDLIADSASRHDEQNERVRGALGGLAKAIEGNRERADEIATAVQALSRRSAELDRNVSRFHT